MQCADMILVNYSVTHIWVSIRMQIQAVHVNSVSVAVTWRGLTECCSWRRWFNESRDIVYWQRRLVFPCREHLRESSVDHADVWVGVCRCWSSSSVRRQFGTSSVGANAPRRKVGRIPAGKNGRVSTDAACIITGWTCGTASLGTSTVTTPFNDLLQPLAV